MVFGTLVGIIVFSVMWSELLMTTAICCPLWSSVYECHKVECAFISTVMTECGMFVMCSVCIVVCLCQLFCSVWMLVSRRYIDACNCVVYINDRRYVSCGECYVVSNECDEPNSCCVQTISVHCCEVMYFGCFGFRGELGFLNCDDICMCVVNKQFELLEFVFDSLYVDMQYDEIYLTFTAGCMCLCVCF